jgi:gliding motility-associated-like protein
MKNIYLSAIFLIFFSVYSEEVKACSPYGTPTLASQNITGNTLNLVWTSTTSWSCSYWIRMEILCNNEPFTGTPNYISGCITKPSTANMNYPSWGIDISALCPGVTYKIRAYEAGCNSTFGSGWSTTYTFTVPSTISPLVVNTSATATNICIPDCTTLTANISGGCGAFTYSWSPGGQTTPNISVCPTVNTTYTVTVQDICAGQSGTSSIVISVLGLPVAGTAAANPTNVCIGETTNLTLTGYDGNIQWQSAPNAGGPWTDIAGAITDNETSPPLNNDICYRAEVTGCGPTQISNIVCVTVAPTPVLTVSNETICLGETTTLTSNVDLTGGTYLWTPTGQNTQDLTNVSPAVTTTYNLDYILNGCTVSETGTITVNPQPTTLNLAGSTLCDGDNATITATPDEPGGTYVWTPNVSNNNTAVVSPGVGTNTYTIDYDLNGCTYSESVDIIVNPVPTVDIAEQEICNGENTTLTAVPDIAGGDFLWAPGGEITDNINVAPNTTTNYSVTYTLNGCIANDNADVIVNPMPTADFNFTDVCEDLVTPLNSTSLVPAPGIIQTNEWDIGNDGSVEYNFANGSHDFGGWGTYDVNLTVTTDAGCTDNMTQTIDVYPLAIVDFDATPLCLGNPTDFTDLTVVPNGGAVNTWDWDFDDGNTGNTQNPQNTYAAAGVYNVDLEITTDNGCITNLTQAVEIFDLPVADFNFVNDCFYEDINFTNTSSGNATNFEWDFDDGSNPNYQENPSNPYNAAGTYDVILIISTDDGCGDQITQTITAYAQPNADFTVDPTCFETISEFTDESTINPVDGDVITGWNWSFGDGNSSNQQNPTNQYAGENVYSTTLTVTTNYGCEDTYVTDAVVWPLPEVDFSPTDVCLEFDTQFQDQSTISNQFTSNNNVNWAWDFADGNNSNQQNPTHTYMTDGVFTANLTVTSNNGCVNDEDIDVTVNPKPEASFTGENLSGCSPVCFSLASTSVVNNPSNIVDYEWNFSDGSTYSSGSSEFQDCFVNNTGNTVTYGVELVVTTDQGCQDTHSETNYISVFHNPIANFSYSPDEVNLLDPTVTFTNSSQYADFYDWTFLGIGSSSDVNPVIEYPAEPETYEIELVAHTDEGCTDTALVAVEILDRIIFYVPNTFTPDNDNFNEIFQPVFTSGFDPQDFNLLIFNRWGEIVFESNDASIGWDGTYGSESGQLVKDGTYVWKIEFKETMTDKRHTHTGHVNILK